MPTPKLPLICLIILIMSLLAFFPPACTARRSIHNDRGFTLCGNLNISFPFRLKTQPRSCGFKGFELVCHNNRTIFPIKHWNFYVQNISYDNQTLRVVDVNLEDNHNCSIPLTPLPFRGRPLHEITILRGSSYIYHALYPDGNRNEIYVVNCSMKVNNSWSGTGVNYINASRCSSSSSPPPTTSNSYYYFLDGGTAPSRFHPSCTVEALVPISLYSIDGLSTSDIYQDLMMGFQLRWQIDKDLTKWNSVVYGLITLITVLYSIPWYIFTYRTWSSYFNKDLQIICVVVTGGILLRTLLGISCLIALVIRKFRRRHLSMDEKIENFLQSQKNFMPIRYSYTELKRITGGFKNKLGQGGYGTVFKGKLRSGKLVAIKLLNQSKGNGQDFINEVASIGRIHHVNVVQLIGFCVEGKKQALVYDFMINGSLDKIIFSPESSSLSWEKMFEIVLGIGQGIEYLHNGCAMQILHFDIKPHNILLDDNFNPKVSDFGLAKLYSVDDSIISLTAARGTFGYMAPELFYKNIGGISYKADVYSFGMMLMEIVGRRRNLNASEDHSSQIYFPTWIYDQFEEGENIELGDMTESESRIVRKMIMVAFWCIQTKPIYRPSMTRVLKMLESEVELLEIPPKSSVFSVNMSCNDSN